MLLGALAYALTSPLGQQTAPLTALAMSRPAGSNAQAPPPLAPAVPSPAHSEAAGSEVSSAEKPPSSQPPALLTPPSSFPVHWLPLVGCWSRVDTYWEDIFTLQPDFTFHFVRLAFPPGRDQGTPAGLCFLVTGRWSALSAEHVPLIKYHLSSKQPREAYLRSIIKPTSRSRSSASERSQHLPESSISLVERKVWTKHKSAQGIDQIGSGFDFLFYALCLTRKGELCEYSNPYQLFTRTQEHHVKEFTHAGTMLSTSHCSHVQPQAADAGAGGSSSAIDGTPA